MKKTTLHWIAIGILLAVIAGFGVKFMILGKTTEGVDGRTIVLLTQSERQKVLSEMRGLLEATRQILEGLASGNLNLVERAARSAGSQAAGTMDFKLKSKLPLAFKKLGFATHEAFDDIARMARKGQTINAIQAKLANTMHNCIACHDSYQLPSSISKGGNL